MHLYKYILFTALLCYSTNLAAQQRKPLSTPKKKTTTHSVKKRSGHKKWGTGVVEAPPPQPQVFYFVSQLPEFPGGEAALEKYLREHIRYPDVAKEEGIEGMVHARFVIDAEGKISRSEILRDIGGGCGREVIRVVQSLPAFKPYKANGRNIPCVFELQTRFTLLR